MALSPQPNCTCYVAQLDTQIRAVLRYGAHNPDCYVYRPSKDPVDRIADNSNRAHYETDATVECRCCGRKNPSFLDAYPICTGCIPRHWARHKNGVNASRCKEFKNA